MTIAKDFRLSLGDIPILLRARHGTSDWSWFEEGFGRFLTEEKPPPAITIKCSVMPFESGDEPGTKNDAELQAAALHAAQLRATELAAAEAYLRNIFGQTWPSPEGGSLLLRNMLDLLGRFQKFAGFRSALGAVLTWPERFCLFVSPDPMRAYAIVLDRHTRQAWSFLPADWPDRDAAHKTDVLSACLRYVLSMVLEQFSGLILHAAGVQEAEGSVLFIGPSGTGKTTLARTRPEAFSVLADDGVIVRWDQERFRAYSTPWNMLNGAWRDQPGAFGRSGEIRAVFLLTDNGDTRPARETPANAVGRSLQQMNPFLWWLDADGQQATWKFLSDLYLAVPAYRFNARAGDEPWRLIDEIISDTKRSEIDD